jgi:hypothetical protein
VKGDRQRQMDSLEARTFELLCAAELFATPVTQAWDLQQRRTQLMSAARAYGRAIDALARVR